MSFELGEVIFYMKEGRIHSSQVLSRMVIENYHHRPSPTKEQRQLFMQFGEAGAFYATCHGIVKDSEAYHSKEALLDAS